MKQKVKNKYSKSMIIPIVLGLILLLLFKSADSKIEQIMIGFIFIINLIPFALHLISMLLTNAIAVPKENRVAETTIKVTDKKSNNDSIKPNYKAKTNNNEFYIEVRSRLIEVVKKGWLDRDSILKFKLELDNRLGVNRYSYSNFNYENDLHEIYIKLKSSKLNDNDYVYLKGLIEDLVG